MKSDIEMSSVAESGFVSLTPFRYPCLIDVSCVSRGFMSLVDGFRKKVVSVVLRDVITATKIEFEQRESLLVFPEWKCGSPFRDFLWGDGRCEESV